LDDFIIKLCGESEYNKVHLVNHLHAIDPVKGTLKNCKYYVQPLQSEEGDKMGTDANNAFWTNPQMLGGTLYNKVGHKNYHVPEEISVNRAAKLQILEDE
jgi:hypothetical protein